MRSPHSRTAEQLVGTEQRFENLVRQAEHSALALTNATDPTSDAFAMRIVSIVVSWVLGWPARGQLFFARSQLVTCSTRLHCLPTRRSYTKRSLRASSTTSTRGDDDDEKALSFLRSFQRLCVRRCVLVVV